MTRPTVLKPPFRLLWVAFAATSFFTVQTRAQDPAARAERPIPAEAPMGSENLWALSLVAGGKYEEAATILRSLHDEDIHRSTMPSYR